MALPPPAGPEPGERLLAGTRWLLSAFAGLTALAVVPLLLFPGRAREDFAWSIGSELTASFLGAGFAAGLVLSLLSLRRDRWCDVRVPVVTVTAYTALVLIASLIHAHRLHLTDGGALARFSAWLWLGVYVVVPVAGVAVVLRQDARRTELPELRRPMPRGVAVLLAVQGAVLVAAGAVLLFSGLTVHHVVERIAGFWPWEITPLSAMVTGAWLVAFGIAAALAIRQRDLGELLVAAVTYTAFGVFELLVLVRYRSQLDPADPWLWAYVVLLAAVAATGAYGWRAALRPATGARAAAPEPAPAGSLPARPRPE
ncbi:MULTISPECIES: hypothetical protein [unclassified Blastococcus]